MRARYEDWVNGLTGDWLISRQRYFGVPIPVWYRVRADGPPDHESLILPADDALPVDPPRSRRPASPSPSATSQAASPPTPT